MAKYSKEQRDRAVDLYIKYERCATDAAANATKNDFFQAFAVGQEHARVRLG